MNLFIGYARYSLFTYVPAQQYQAHETTKKLISSWVSHTPIICYVHSNFKYIQGRNGPGRHLASSYSTRARDLA